MVCPYCSAFIQDPKAIFCENCGSRLNQQQNNPATYAQAQTRTPQSVGKQKNNTLTVCICVIIAVAIMCGTAIALTVILHNREDTLVVQQGSTQVETEKETEKEEVVPVTEADDYILPTHNTYITFDTLSAFSKDEVDLICNEMYARHGQIFKKEKNQRYFEQQSWYEGKYTSMEYVVTLFNKYEKTNLETIADYRRHMGWN